MHLVDLDGAKQNRIINYKILEKISSQTNINHRFLEVDLKSEEDIKIAFENGAKQVTLGSIAVKNPELFLKSLEKIWFRKNHFGSRCKERKNYSFRLVGKPNEYL